MNRCIHRADRTPGARSAPRAHMYSWGLAHSHACLMRCLVNFDMFLEDFIDEGVHDGHDLGRYANIQMHLLQYLEYVDLVCLNTLLETL